MVAKAIVARKSLGPKRPCGFDSRPRHKPDFASGFFVHQRGLSCTKWGKTIVSYTTGPSGVRNGVKGLAIILQMSLVVHLFVENTVYVKLISTIVLPLCFQFLQERLEVKVFDIPAGFTFLYGSTESCYLLLIFFQPP